MSAKDNELFTVLVVLIETKYAMRRRYYGIHDILQ